MFSIRLKELREKNGYKSQQAFADAFGVAQSTVGGWESGKREPNLETTKRIAAFFNVSIDYLLGVEKAFTPYESNDIFDLDKYTRLKVGAPQPVSLLCQIYGIDTELFDVICKGVHDPDYSSTVWVDGSYRLSNSESFELYPQGKMLEILSNFFILPSSSLSKGGSFPIAPNKAVQEKLNQLRDERSIKSYIRYKDLEQTVRLEHEGGSISGELSELASKKSEVTVTNIH